MNKVITSKTEALKTIEVDPRYLEYCNSDLRDDKISFI